MTAVRTARRTAAMGPVTPVELETTTVAACDELASKCSQCPEPFAESCTMTVDNGEPTACTQWWAVSGQYC